MALPTWFNSPIFGGGLILMLSGFILALARDIPKRLFIWLKSQVTIMVVVTNSDTCFNWLTLWLNEHPYTKKARRLAVSTQQRSRKDEDGTPVKIIFSPSPGNHFLSYKGKWIWLSRVRKDPVANNMASFMERPEEFTFTMFGRDQQVIRELINEAHEVMLAQQQKGASVFTHTWSYWTKLRCYEPRPFESVILPGNMAEEILEDIKEFLTSRQWYQERGIPYRRGYGFWGTPGSGKTSLIMGISDKLKLNIFVLSLGSKSLNDDSLPNLMLEIPPGSIVLMEDIDAVVSDREKDVKPPAITTHPSSTNDKRESSEVIEEKPKHVSLSCLLNCLDGVVAGNGNLVFMTTNYPERLDPALIRPGRVDVKKEFGYVVPEQAQKLFTRFYPTSPELMRKNLGFAVSCIKITMAQLQQIFLENKFNAAGSLQAVESLNSTHGKSNVFWEVETPKSLPYSEPI